MSRRKKEPDPKTLIRFIAEHESLRLVAEEYPELGEERIREILRLFASDPAAPKKQAPEPTRDAAEVAPKEGSERRVVLYTDGASRGNPGPAGAGWVILSPDGRILTQGHAFLGRRTNNEAEYEAVIRGLNAALEFGADEVALRADSELLIKQLNGEYQVRNPRMVVLHQAARTVLQRLRRFEARHVRREQNGAADAMANEAIDSAHGRPTSAF